MHALLRIGTTQEYTHLLHKGADIPKLFQDGLVRNGADIFNVIERLSLLFAGHPTQRLPRVDALEDTKATKILDGELQHFQASRTTNEACFQTRVLLFLFLAHARQLALGAGRRTQGGLDRRLLRAALDAISHLACIFFSNSGREGTDRRP